MKQNIRNVVLTLGLVAFTTYFGTAFYNKQSVQQAMVVRNSDSAQFVAEENLQKILDEREQKKDAAVFAAHVAETKRQAEAEELAIAAAKDEVTRQAAIEAMATAEARRQADALANEQAAQIEIQKAVKEKAARLAAEKAAEEAAAKKSARRSRAS